jgi:hypothetical protein
MSNEKKTPRERLREALELLDTSPGGPGDTLFGVLEAARAVLADPEPAPLTASGEFLEALDALTKWFRARETGDANYNALRHIGARLLRAPRPRQLQDELEWRDQLTKRWSEKLAAKTRECEAWRRNLDVSTERLQQGTKRIAELESQLEATREDADENFRQMELHGKARSELEAELKAMIVSAPCAGGQSVMALKACTPDERAVLEATARKSSEARHAVGSDWHLEWLSRRSDDWTVGVAKAELARREKAGS